MIMPHPFKFPRKLIEVALPLDAINVACSKEKSIRHGHPSTLHLWWARRPLAAARAVIFAQLVNDPGYQQGGGFRYGKNKKEAAVERKRLFKIIEDLVLWENTINEVVLESARAEIRRSWREICELNKDHPQAADLFNPGKLPALHDPFAGGGAIPLEAQRLGLETYASDLNPVAVLINKAMIEIPAKFTGRAPINAPSLSQRKIAVSQDRWKGAKGLAEDVRYYGAWLRSEAENRIGKLYPKIEITVEMVAGRPDLAPFLGQKLNVVAWLWARTVKSPNPAFSHVDVPLASTFILSIKDGKQTYVEPQISGDSYRFEVKLGTPKDMDLAKNGTKLSRGANFRCLLSNSPIEPKYIKAEGMSERIGQKLMAIVAEGMKGRVYISPTAEHEQIARAAKPDWLPDVEISPDRRSMFTPLYGLTHFKHLFTPRQLVTLNTFAELVKDAIDIAYKDAVAALPTDDQKSLEAGGIGATAYAQAIGMYLGMAVSKLSDAQSSLCRWKPSMDQSIATFGRQALPMVWDYSEANAFGGMAGDFAVTLRNMTRVLDESYALTSAHVFQADAQTQTISSQKVISTDPPYYDNIGYADLSEYFYIWLRRSLRSVFPDIFGLPQFSRTLI
jgi:putative DNA methylase